LSKALWQRVAVLGVFAAAMAAAMVVAMVPTDAPSNDASKHWCDVVSGDGDAV
jgi:hypothetical protein